MMDDKQVSYSITDKEFNQLTAFIKKNYGINLREEKRALVIGRLQNVLVQNNIKDFSKYYELVISDKSGEMAATLINRITTNHTFFMREADHFYYFRDTVLPYLKNAVKSRDLRIWSAGCSTGEEPYTLAMIIDEYFGAEKAGWDTRILATDISERVLAKAKVGIYDNENIASLPPQWRLKYFSRLDDKKSVITDKMKNEVIFRKFNLADGVFPFKRKFHVVFCRNVMIYFDTKTKEDVIDRFYNSMEHGAYLFIGHSESINREKTRLKYIIPAVYRKT